MSKFAYFAGFFDGEGCVCIYQSRGPRDRKDTGRTTISVSVANTNKEVLDQFSAAFGGKVGTHGHTKPRPGRDRLRMWNWAIQGLKCKPFLEAIRPYAVVKSEQIRLGLEYLDFCEKRAERKERGTSWSDNLARYIPFQRYTAEDISLGLDYGRKMGRLNNPAGVAG